MKRILIVDDEADLTWSLGRWLSKRFPHWGFLTATSFQKAEDLLKTRPVDILVTDYRLPDGSGVDLIQAAKKKNPNVIPILISAYGVDSVMKILLDHPDVLYVEKPFEIDKICRVLQYQIQQPMFEWEEIGPF